MKQLCSIFFSLLLAATFLKAQVNYNAPESVVYDAPRSRYLVSNAGDGSIIARNLNGDLNYFNQGSSSGMRGITIYNNKLYAAANEGVIEYNLTNGQKTNIVEITDKLFLNDIIADDNSNLYVSDTDAHKIYRVNLSTMIAEIFIEMGTDSPNGLFYDKANNRLIVVLWEINARILAVDLNTKAITTIRTTNFSNCDGITIDQNGNYYISEWGHNTVQRFNNTFSDTPEVVANGYNGPADIYFDQINNILAIPNMDGNNVDFKQIQFTDVGSSVNSLPESFVLYQNYPNPFNPTTVIGYQLPVSNHVTLEVYDLLGREVATLVNEEKAPGNYEVKFDASKLPSGVYIYRLLTDKYVKAIKMILAK